MRHRETIVWGEEILLSGRTLRMHAEGVSMFPRICPGDTLEIRPIAGAKAELGDVVVFCRGGGLVAHRVIAREGLGEHARLVTKGDFLEGSDPEFDCSRVLGRVVRIERNGRIVGLESPPRRALARFLGPLAVRRHLLRLGLLVMRRTRRTHRPRSAPPGDHGAGEEKAR